MSFHTGSDLVQDHEPLDENKLSIVMTDVCMLLNLHAKIDHFINVLRE